MRPAWLIAYGTKATRFNKLAKEVREEFLEQDDVLDAWVARRLPTAREALDQHPLYRTRRSYIPFAVQIGDVATGEMIDQPEPTAFRQAFERDRAIVAMWVTVAVARRRSLARWHAGRSPETRRSGCNCSE